MTGFRILLLLGIIQQNAFASGHQFGGSCASQGSWTARALDQSQQLIDVVNSLKNDPACRAFLKDDLEAKEGFTLLHNALEESAEAFSDDSRDPFPRRKRGGDDEDEAKQSWESLPRQIADVRAMMQKNSSKNESLADILMKLSIESVVGGEAGSDNPAVQYQALKRRTNRSAKVGLQGFNRILLSIPSLDECLIGAPDVGARLFSTVFDMAASFASSEPGAAGMIGGSIENLVNILRERRFTLVLRRIKKAQFINSVSCLLESTAQVYCTTNEAIELFEVGLDERWARQNAENESSPLEGYFLLTREGNIITNWMTTVIRGIDPKWKTDANFKNEVITSVMGFLESVNNVTGQFNEGLFNITKEKSQDAKRNFLFKAIEELVVELATEEPGYFNFFTASKNKELIPYFLIGMDRIPEKAYGTQGLIEWQEFFKNYGPNNGFLRQFDDPTQLIQIVKAQLDKLVWEATKTASLYYVERLIVDPSLLVTEATTPSQSYNLSVLDSLVRVQRYLEKLKKRIIANRGDKLMLPLLNDTNERITKLLNAFEVLRSVEIQNSTDWVAVKAAYKNAIETAFIELNMLLQREGFILNRLSNFVRYDYSMRVKNKENMSRFQQELMIIAGRELMDRFQSVYEKSPADIRLDLANAQAMINQPNLRALEDLFGDMFFAVLEELKLREEDPRATSLDLASTQWKRKMTDANKGLYHAFKEWMMNGKSHSEKYGFDEAWTAQPLGSDEKFNVQIMRAKMCIQSLAFERGDRYAPFCQGVTLNGLKDPNDKRTLIDLDLNANYDQILASSKQDKPYSWMGIEGSSYLANMERKCAFRNYLRKNQVYWMTQEINSSK